MNTFTNSAILYTKSNQHRDSPVKTICTLSGLETSFKQDNMSYSGVVCAQHFQQDDTFVTGSGSQELPTGTISSTVLVCMMCLDTDRKMILLSELNLVEAYVKLTGYPLCDGGNLKQTLCVQCAQKLRNFSRFRDNSLRARSLLMELLEKHELITIQHIKILQCRNNELKNINLVFTTLGPDHCDLYILEKSDENRQTDLEETVHGVAVKPECSDDSQLVDEDTKVIYEEHNNKNSIKEEFDEDLVKYESAAFKCTVCYEEFNHEHAYSAHVSMHMHSDMQLSKHSAHSVAFLCNKNEEFDVDLVKYGSAAFKCTVCYEEFNHEHAYSAHVSMHMHSDMQPSKHSAHNVAFLCNKNEEFDEDLVKNESAAFKCTVCYEEFDHEHACSAHVSMHMHSNMQPSKHSAYSMVNPLFARLATNTGNEEANTTQNSEQELINSATNNRTLDSGDTTMTNIKSCNVKLYDISKFPQNARIKVESSTQTLNEPAATTVPSETEACISGNTPSTNTVTCNVCQRVFTQKRHLTRHMLIHTGEKPFSCDLCNYKCREKSHLIRHMLIHTGEKPYSCKLCSYKCTRKHGLNKHMLTHPGEKGYSCKICNYKCILKCDLAKHMRSHTDKKPYFCNLCNYKCTEKGNLNRHMQIHTGEKPYSCELCRFKTKHKCNLIVHMWIHTDQKPYSCKLCSYKCIQKKQLIKHMGTHTGE